MSVYECQIGQDHDVGKRINVVLSEKTISLLDRATTKGNRSRFIDLAVLHYLETHAKHSLREQLAAGYRANAERDLEMAVEWFPLEEGAWRRFELSRSKTAERRHK